MSSPEEILDVIDEGKSNRHVAVTSERHGDTGDLRDMGGHRDMGDMGDMEDMGRSWDIQLVHGCHQ